MNYVNNKCGKTLHKEAGFTLLEMMVVVMIIGMLAAMVVPNLLRNKDKANQKKVVADIVALEGVLDLYQLDNNRYPTSQEGLNILVAPGDDEEGYIRRIPKDPWGREYHYLYPGTHGKVDIYTLGEDGLEGGKNAARDIGNWDINDF